jgi:hypothetical protein
MHQLVVIDDNLRLASSLADLLAIEGLGHATVCAGLDDLRRSLPPQVIPYAVIADVHVRDASAEDLASALRGLWPAALLVGWSAADQAPRVRQLFDAFVHKSDASAVLPRLLRSRLTPQDSAPAGGSGRTPRAPVALSLREDVCEIRRLLDQRDVLAVQRALHRLLGAAQWTRNAALEALLLRAQERIAVADWQGAGRVLDGSVEP